MRILLSLFLPVVAVCQQSPPVIDVHMHANAANSFGALGIKACPGDVAKAWPAVDPRSTRITPDALEDCPNPIYALKTDREIFETTKQLMEKFNITAVLSGPENEVGRWAAGLGTRAIPAITVPSSPCQTPFFGGG